MQALADVVLISWLAACTGQSNTGDTYAGYAWSTLAEIVLDHGLLHARTNQTPEIPVQTMVYTC